MKPSKRLERIPPYAFAQLESKIAAKRAAGVDVISLGIGDPDRPTPPLIVEAMQEAVTEPETHRYPSNRGRADFRGARLTHCEFRRSDLTGLQGVESLRGAALEWPDIVEMAGVWATALGIEILEADGPGQTSPLK